MKLIDANIFLEILLKQDKVQIAKNVIRELIETQETFIVTSFTIHTIIVILQARNKISELMTFMKSMSAFDNAILYYPNFDEELAILNRMDSLKLDFDDATQYVIAEKLNAEILTFDSDFRNVTGVSVKIL